MSNTKNEKPMKRISNKVLVAAAAFLAIVLADSLSATAGPRLLWKSLSAHWTPVAKPHKPGTQRADSAQPRRPKVEVSSSMPSSFRERKENCVLQPDSLFRLFDLTASKERPLRVLHIGDSHVKAGSFSEALKEKLQAAFGAADTDSATSGIRFSYIGSNGATTARFLTDSYKQRFADFKPDLIVLSLGTNECHGWGYREESHRPELESFLDFLQAACPAAVILLTTPPGDYLSRSTVSYVYRGKGSNRKRRRVVRSHRTPNPMSTRCAALIDSVGKERGLPVWDLQTICGGEAAVRNYVAAGLMRPDRIHFTPEGYQLHGHLLGEAILNAYNDYVGL